MDKKNINFEWEMIDNKKKKKKKRNIEIFQ